MVIVFGSEEFIVTEQLSVFKENLSVKKDVSDGAVRRMSESSENTGTVSVEWHRGYNRAIVECLADIEAVINGEAIAELVRPRNLRPPQTP
jgi:hypothetical protein